MRTGAGTCSRGRSSPARQGSPPLPGPRSGELCVEYLTSSLPFCLFLPLPPDRTCEQLGGACLLGIGTWVMVDPTGFREIVAANPLLITGVYILLAMGGLLFLLGFLGCCGAVRENKCLLLFVSTPSPTPPVGTLRWEVALCLHCRDSHRGLSPAGCPPGVGGPPPFPIGTCSPSLRSLPRGQAAPRESGLGLQV